MLNLASALLIASLAGRAGSLPEVSGLDGRNHRLLGDAGGRTIALVFISHDCPICNSYAPEFARIGATFGKQALVGLVYEDPGISLAVARKHAREYGLTGLRLYIDRGAKLAEACGAGILPEAVVLDGQGKRSYVGRIDDLYYDFGKRRATAKHHEMREAIQAVLDHRPVKPASGPPFGCVIETTSLP